MALLQVPEECDRVSSPHPAQGTRAAGPHPAQGTHAAACLLRVAQSLHVG